MAELSWEVVDTFLLRTQAELLWSYLDGHGIPARVRADDAGNAGGLALGGVTVEVPTDRADEARALIEAASD